jgi:eukaryotic-like serine/threonine-protein kinase
MMTSPDKWEAVKELFEAALEEDSARRSSFIENRCSDPVVRAEVERLLAEHEQAGTFLSTPVLDNVKRETEAAPRSQRLSDGEFLAGRFRIVRFLASGGMGEVYEAEDEELRERVAIKTIRPEILIQPNSLARFRREVHLARQVTHPNVCRVFDLFRHNPASGENPHELVFISMELLHGPHLGQRLKDGGRMSTAEALPLIRQMASALAAAHAVGIVHRDFKPQNVVLVPVAGQNRRRAVVTDFGLALQPQASSEASLSTGPGLLGTPAYMSPEQIEGRPATAASDIYALGLVTYEMVTGNRPFQGDTPMSAAMKRLSEVPIPPRKFQPGLSSEWESVILRCLERDPAKRFANAEGVALTLAGEDATQSRVGALPGSPKRRMLIVAFAVLLVVAAVLGYEVRHREGSDGRTPPKVNPRRSVAVLGFKNLSGKPDEGWLSTALSEMLTTELSSGEHLRTVPGENLAQMKASLGIQDADGYGKETLGRIHRVVDADEVLVGSYLALGKETGGKVHLDLKLQDVGAGETTAAIVEDGTEDQLPELVSRAGAALLQKLGVSDLTPAQSAELTASVSHNPEANRLYAEGLVKLRDYDPLAARDLFQKAVNLDDNFALSHSSLSRAWAQLGYDQKSKDEAKRALDLSAGLSRENRLVIEGRYLSATRDWPRAIDVYNSLYTFFPDNPEYGLLLAAAQTSGGKAKDALLIIDQLRRLPPPLSDDPRIDLQEASSAGELSDARRKLAAAQRAEQKAKSAGLQLVAANARFAAGGALYELGELKQAMTAYQEALQTYLLLKDRSQVANAYYEMSQDFDDMGDRTSARKAAEQSLAIYQEIGNIHGQAKIISEIGIVMRHAGDLRGAAAEFEKSYQLQKDLGDKGGMIAAHGNLANVLSDQGDLRGSLEKLEEVTRLALELGNRRYQTINQGNLAYAEFKLGEVPTALQDFQQALDLSRQIGNKFATIWQFGALAEMQIETGDLRGATMSTADAIELSRNAGEGGDVASSVALQGEIAFIKGDLNRSRQLYQQSLDEFHKSGDQNAAAQISYALADLALEQGSLAEAEQFARQAAVELDKEKAESAAVAHATLARVLLAQGKSGEAQTEIVRASATSRTTQNLTVSIPVQIASADVQAESGSPETAIRLLQKLARDSERYRFLNEEFQARLALGEIQMRSQPKVGIATLQALVRDSDARGFSLVSSKATAAVKKTRQTDIRQF